MPEAAEILYDIINNVNMLDKKTPILVACNKQDLQFSKRCNQVQQELERELEELRKVRRATQDDEDTAKEYVAKAGLLEQQSKPFKFSDPQLRQLLPPIKFCETSLIKQEFGEVHKFIIENM